MSTAVDSIFALLLLGGATIAGGLAVPGFSCLGNLKSNVGCHPFHITSSIISWEPFPSRRRVIPPTRAKWNPAVEEEPELSDDENLKKMKVEELLKDEYLTPAKVNELMVVAVDQRREYSVNPEMSFGAVFQLDTLVDVVEGLIHPAWCEVARALDRGIPEFDTVKRYYGLNPYELMIRAFRWDLDQEDAVGGLEVYERTIHKLAGFYKPKEKFGHRRWLETIERVQMPMVVLSRLSGEIVEEVLNQTNLSRFFQNRVVGEDEMFDDYRGFLLAALKMGRPTTKCCVFDCREDGMIKAHEAEMRGICQTSVLPAWELHVADLAVDYFDSLTFMDFRQCFADRELETGQPDTQVELFTIPKTGTTETRAASRWADDYRDSGMGGPETLTDGDGGGGNGGGRSGGYPGWRKSGGTTLQ